MSTEGPRPRSRARRERLESRTATHQQRYDRDHEECDKQDLGYPCGADGDPREAEEGSDERDDEENDGVVEHGSISSMIIAAGFMPQSIRGAPGRARQGRSSDG